MQVNGNTTAYSTKKKKLHPTMSNLGNCFPFSKSPANHKKKKTLSMGGSTNNAGNVFFSSAQKQRGLWVFGLSLSLVLLSNCCIFLPDLTISKSIMCPDKKAASPLLSNCCISLKQSPGCSWNSDKVTQGDTCTF